MGRGLLAPLLALAVHAPVLGHGLLWDDAVIFGRQLPVLTIGRIFAPPAGLAYWTYHYYRPAAVLSLWLDRALYGSSPFGFHFTVWLLHGATTYALYLLGRRFLAPAAALLGASLFAVYPLHAEAVGWIAGRTDVLAGLFGISAAAIYLAAARAVAGPSVPHVHAAEGKQNARAPGVAHARGTVARGRSRIARENTERGLDATDAPPDPPVRAHEDARGRATESDRGARRSPIARHPMLGWVLCGCLVLLALLSKESAIALVPFLLAAAWLSGVRARPLVWASLAAILPVLVYLAMRISLNPHQSTESFAPGVYGPAGAVLWTGAYASLRLVIPLFGSPFGLAPSPGALPIIGLVCLSGAGVALAFRSGRKGRIDLLLPLIWTAAGIAVLAAAAAWNTTRTLVADRYFYVPAAGWCLLLAAGSFPAASGRDAGRGRSAERRGGLSAIGWALVVVFAAMTLVKTRLYADDRTYWTAATQAEPTWGAARMNLGNALYATGELEASAAAYRSALELDLRGVDRPLAMSDLGSVLYRMGQPSEAEAALREASSLPGEDATVSFNLGAFLYQKGFASQSRGGNPQRSDTFEEARSWLERAVSQDPYHAGAWTLLGNCYEQAGQSARAREAWKKALEIDGREGTVGREAARALDRLGGPGRQ